MIQEIVNLNGYGQYVWPAFFFTILSCYLLYIQTIKELKRQEELFLNEFKQSKTNNSVLVENNRKIKRKTLSDNPVY